MKSNWICLMLTLTMSACGSKPEAEEGAAAGGPRVYEGLQVEHRDEFVEDGRGIAHSGEWVRRVYVVNRQGRKWPVEKYDFIEEAWIMVGSTDESGVYLDGDVDEVAQYRMGGEEGTTTKRLPGLHTEVISNSQEISHEQMIISKRVVVAAGVEFRIHQGGRLRIYADEVILDGSILGPSAHHFSAGAGSVEIFAKRVSGDGKIYLVGAAGQVGAKGRNGENGNAYHMVMPDPGAPGGQGSQGGVGGSLKVYSVEATGIPKENFSVKGGLGGPGGPGGAGGRIVYHAQGGRNEGAPQGPQGPRGLSGADGDIYIGQDYEGLHERIQEQLVSKTFPE